MAQERMAEGTPETGPILPTEGPLAQPEIPERDSIGRTLSEFERAQYLYDYYLRFKSRDLSDTDKQSLENIRRQFKDRLETRANEADKEGVLGNVREEGLDLYNDVKVAKRRERERGRPTKADIIKQAWGRYREEWNRPVGMRELEGTYRGAQEYVWEGLVDAIDREYKHDNATPPLSEAGQRVFEDIKKQREIDRQQWKQKYYTEISYFGEAYDDLNWPEKPEEFPIAILDWVKDKTYHLNELGTDIQAIVDAYQKFRKRGVDLIDNRRLRLKDDEEIEISEKDPNILRAVAIVEGVMDAMAYEAIIYKGGEEQATQIAEREGSNYVYHEEAIRLANSKVAYIEHKLKKWKDKNHRGHADSVCKGGTYFMGSSWDVEKELEGPIADYRRQQAEEEIIEDAQRHDLYINVISKNLFGIEDAFKYRLGDNPRKRDLRYSFEDNIEQLLLDPGDQARQRIVARYGEESDEIKRHDFRVGVFQEIKNDADRRDGFVESDGSLVTEEERRKRVRKIILRKMEEKGEDSYIAQMTRKYFRDEYASGDFGKLEWVNMTEGTQGYDRMLWQWVRDYNEYKLKERWPRFFPTSWDRVRWNIDSPTKVIDRMLTEEEFEAMYEPVPPPENLNYDDPAVINPMHDARFGFQLARAHMILNMEDAIWGGIRTRDIDPKTGDYRDPEHKLKRISDIVQENLEEAIKDEEQRLNRIRTAWRAAEEELRAAKVSENQDLIKEKKAQRKEKYKAWHEATTYANFLPVHALKEAGLVSGKLPVWSQNFLDQSTIEAFTRLLADYGVHTAYGVPISQNDKRVVYEILERGRRAWKAENDRAAEQFMEGRWPVFQRDEDGRVIEDEHGNPIPAEAFFMAEREFWDPGEPIIKQERYRIISKGGVRQHRQINDARYELSTSGGMRVQELNYMFGDLGYVPPGIKWGAIDSRERYGFLKRRDEVEFHEHKFLDTMDPIHDARERRAAYVAYKGLTGGSLGEGQSTPGQLKEPFKGAYQTADYLQERIGLIDSYEMKNTYYYLLLMQRYRNSNDPYSKFKKEWSGKVGSHGKEIQLEGEDIERYRQFSYLDIPKASKVVLDGLFEKVAGGLTYLRDYFQAEDPVENQRAGIAFGNLAYDNFVKFVTFREQARKAMQMEKPERGFIIRLGYAPEIASEIAMGMLDIVLADDFKIPRPHDRERLAQQGALMKAKELGEQLRVSGLQLFMDVEGYQVVHPDGKRRLAPDGKPIGVLGTKIPQLVREQMHREDPMHKLLTHPT